MPGLRQDRVLGNDVFALTGKGRAELHGAGTSLTPSEIEVLVLPDGKSTAGETAARANAWGARRTERTWQAFPGGLIELVRDEEVSFDFVDFFEIKGLATSSAAATAKGKKQAAATVALLQEKGYSVRIARRARQAMNMEQIGA